MTAFEFVKFRVIDPEGFYNTFVFPYEPGCFTPPRTFVLKDQEVRLSEDGGKVWVSQVAARFDREGNEE